MQSQAPTGSAECADKVADVSLPLSARADDLEAERVVDREHGRVGERVVRPHPSNLRPLVSDPFEHRRLRPLGETPPTMSAVDARVLLNDGAGIPRLEGDLRAADTRASRITHEHRPSRSTRLDERPVKLGHEVGIDDHVTHIEAVPRSGLHDVVKRRSVGAEILGKDPVDHLEAVAETSRPLSARPAPDHRPVDVAKHQLTRAVHPGDPGTDAAREGVTGWYSVDGRPREQGPAILHGLLADRGKEPRPDALTAVIPPYEQVTLHDSTVAGGVRPAEPRGDGRDVRGLD